jgi:hypothetical protein
VSGEEGCRPVSAIALKKNFQTPNSVARPQGVLRSPFRGGFGGFAPIGRPHARRTHQHIRLSPFATGAEGRTNTSPGRFQLCWIGDDLCHVPSDCQPGISCKATEELHWALQAGMRRCAVRGSCSVFGGDSYVIGRPL